MNEDPLVFLRNYNIYIRASDNISLSFLYYANFKSEVTAIINSAIFNMTLILENQIETFQNLQLRFYLQYLNK